MPSRWTRSHVPPWAPSTVRAQAWDRFGRPSRRRPSTNSVGNTKPRPETSDTVRPCPVTSVTVSTVPLWRRAFAEAHVGVHQYPVTGRVDALAVAPCRPGDRLAHQFAARDVDGADAVGQVLGIGVADGQRNDVRSPASASATTASARAWRVAVGVPQSCSQPASVRMV